MTPEKLTQEIKNKIQNSARPLGRALAGAGALTLILTGAPSALATTDQNFNNCQLLGDAGIIYLAVPGIVGPCTEQEQFTDSTGLNSFQHTTGGEFFKTGGREAFTNGGTTWEVVPDNFRTVAGQLQVASRPNGSFFPWENGQPVVITTTNPNFSSVPQSGTTIIATGGHAEGGSVFVHLP